LIGTNRFSGLARENFGMGSEESGGKLAKLASGAFALIVAPILVGVAVNYSQKIVDSSKPEPAKEAEASKSADPRPADARPPDARPADPKPSESKPADAGTAETKPAKPAPDATAPLAAVVATKAARGAATRAELRKAARTAPRLVRVFNGRDLTGFYTLLGAPTGGGDPLGKDNDPEKVFSVRAGSIHISGKLRGGLVTQDAYHNYHLTMKYRWGDKTWYPRKVQPPRSSAVMLHCVGSELTVPRPSIRCHLSEAGFSGDLNVIEGPAKNISMSVEAAEQTIDMGKVKRPNLAYRPAGALTKVTDGVVHHLAGMPAERKKDSGVHIHASHNWEKPLGEWNTLEFICFDDEIRVILNGKKINQVTVAGPNKGRIMLASDFSEIYFDDITLESLTEAPK
jgi:hypothetical protein